MATRLASPMSPASQWAAKPDRRHVLTFELGRLRRTRSALLGSRRGTRQMPWRTLLEIKRHSSGGSRANFRANSARRGPAARRARCGRRAADAGRATRSGTSRALRVRGSREMCGSAVREPRQIVVRSVWGWECSVKHAPTTDLGDKNGTHRSRPRSRGGRCALGSTTVAPTPHAPTALPTTP